VEKNSVFEYKGGAHAPKVQREDCASDLQRVIFYLLNRRHIILKLCKAQIASDVSLGRQCYKLLFHIGDPTITIHRGPV
jgi:hypothetical protein